MDYRLAQRKGRCVQVSYDDGKTWVSTGCRTKTEARYKLGVGSLITLGEYAKDFFIRTDEDSFIYRQKARGKSIYEHRQRTKQYRLDEVIIPVFGRMKVIDIKARDIEGWFMRLKQPDGTPYANQTKNDIITIFRQVLDNAMLDGVVETNEAKKIRSYTRKTRAMGSMSKKELDLLLPEDDDKLIENFKGNIYLACYFSIFRDTGFRPCEILALRRADIREDLTVYTEWIYDTHAKELANRIKTSGHGKDYKVGKLTEQSKRLIDRTADNEYIFIDNFDKLDVNNINREFKNAVYKVLKRTDLTQYCLRHAFMTNLIGKYPRELIMELMGHTTWESCYDDRTPDMLLDNLRKALKNYQE